MSELALYRKYRPESFDEAIGQEHVVKVLEAAVQNGRIAHAYLFFGSRGTGKTTFARILARRIGTSDEDLYEIDAASNRGIDDIRELRESVKTLPFRSPYKVYIIDEVHMLTKEAFNALLKTLEEPPKHVIFILATTEQGKLPETIISRCETHTFKKPSHTMLRKSVTDIAKKEGYAIDGDAVDLIATVGDGSFRDTQVILQKVLHSNSGKKVSLEHVEQVTSAPSNQIVNEIVTAIAEGDLEKGLTAVGKAAEQSTDFLMLIRLILKKVRMIMLMRLTPGMKTSLADGYSENEIAFIEKLSAKEGAKVNSSVILELINAYALSERSYVPELPLELALIKILGVEK